MLYQDYLTKKKPYQEFGSIFLLERKHACLYYKPGKGKTYPCIDAIREVDKMKNNKAKVLILSTPDAIRNMWLAEIDVQKIMPENTVYMSLNSAIQEKTKVKLLSMKWDVIVVDECHKIKSHNAKSSKLVYGLSRKTEYVWGLSGTPRGNSDVDIYCQFHNMCIGEWGQITYTQFIDNCCIIDQKFFKGNCIKVPVGIKDNYKVGWENNIAKFTQRVGYSEEDNMPDLKINAIPFNYKPTKEYLDAEQNIIRLSEYETTMTKLAAIQKMWQAVNGFLYYKKDDDPTDTNNYTHHIERNIKLDWLGTNLKPNNVIVYMFEQDCKYIIEELEKLNFSWTEDVSTFKSGKADILLLQCSRCESFNLQMCKRIIFYTFDYSYIKYNQMLHRVWRMGQTEQVEIVVLYFKDTIENKIWKSVQNKESLAELFMSIKGVL